MKYRPDDAEVLDAIATLLEDDVLEAVAPDLRHRVRVAANLARILERSATLEPAALRRETARLAELLDRRGPLADLRADLDGRLRDGDPSLDEMSVWRALVETARDDLSVTKPGYDSWQGR